MRPKIAAQIGAGGMGEVYRATDGNLKRQVAIKVLPPRSQRIARLRAPDASRQAGMPLDEALPIAKKIAEALEAAHEQGIIHRDR